MKQMRPTQEHTLESLRFFPHVAWTLVIGFSLFVYGITKNVTKEVNDLNTLNVEIESQLSAPKPKPVTPSPQP